MAVFMLEDEIAKVEAVVFPEAFAKFGGAGRRRRDAARARQVRARRGDEPAGRVRDHAARRRARARGPGSGDSPDGGRVGKDSAGKDKMRALAAVLEQHPGDRRVSFVVEVNGAGPHLRTRVADGAPNPPERSIRPRRRDGVRGGDGHIEMRTDHAVQSSRFTVQFGVPGSAFCWSRTLNTESRTER